MICSAQTPVELSELRSLNSFEFLQLQDKSKACVNLRLHSRWQLAHMFREECAIEGQKLGNIDNRIAGQSCGSRRQQEIAGRFGEPEIAGDDRNDYGLNAAAVEGVSLNHQNRPAETRLRAARIRQVGPPNLSSGHRGYQESLLRDFNWARFSAGSSLAGSCE